MRYEPTDFEWAAIRTFLPNKPRGIPRVDDRRVLNGIFWVLRSGAPWRDLPETYGPRTTCYNRFVRWRQAGVWDRIMDALAAGHDAAVQMIDTSVVRVHQHGACVADNDHQDMGRSRGGLTSKIHAVVDTNGLPVHLALTPGEGARQSAVFGSSRLFASKDDVARGSRIRRGLDQGAGPPAGCVGEHPTEAQSQRPHLLQPAPVSRPQLDLNKIKQCRRVATRYDKLAANYLAFVKLASIRIWLRANEFAA
jgi:transposase